MQGANGNRGYVGVGHLVYAEHVVDLPVSYGYGYAGHNGKGEADADSDADTIGKITY